MRSFLKVGLGLTVALVACKGGGGASAGSAQDLVSDGGSAIAPSSACDLSGVASVVVPASYADASVGTLELRYRKFPSAKPGARTIVVVPGGPGEDIMHLAPSGTTPLGGITPDSFNVIYADARGSGCNTYAPMVSPEKVYTAEAVARDVLAVVEAEHLQDYYLYAVSFGTVAATMAGAIAERESRPAPRRIVLEGTVGHAFASFDEYMGAFTAEWERVKLLIEPFWRTSFDTEPFPIALFWTRDQWGAFIAEQLILGDLPGQGPILQHWLTGLGRQDPAAQTYVGTFMAGVVAAPTPELFRTIACRELWGGWQEGRRLQDGRLIAFGPDLCAGQAKEAPYDSAAWALHVPITYFQGPFDPTTTMAQARYHFDQHPAADRQFVTVPGAAHAPLTLGLAGRGCAAAVWQAIDSDPAKLGDALGTCAKPDGVAIDLQAAPAVLAR